MSDERVRTLSRGLVVGGAVGALLLLVLFHAVVSGAVSRAAEKHAEPSRATVSATPGLFEAPSHRVLLARAAR